MPVKDQFGKKISQGCNVILQAFLSTPDSPMRGVDFRIRISPRIRSQNWNGLKGGVRDLGQSDLCKNIEKTVPLTRHYLFPVLVCRTSAASFFVIFLCVQECSALVPTVFHYVAVLYILRQPRFEPSCLSC